LSIAIFALLSPFLTWRIFVSVLALTGAAAMVESCSFRRVKHYEDDVSAVAQKTGAQAWIYGAHGDAQWTQGLVCAASEGARTPDGLKGASPKGCAVDDGATSSGERAPDLGLRRAQRVRSGALFQDAYAQGRMVRGRLMVLYPRLGPGAALRLGVVASRKVGGAVERARAKRRLRAAWRLNRAHFRGAVDLIVVARRELLGAPWSEVQDELRRLGRRAGLVATEGGAR